MAKHDQVQLERRSYGSSPEPNRRVSPLPLPLPLAVLRLWPTGASSSLLSSFVSTYCEQVSSQTEVVSEVHGNPEISLGRQIRVPLPAKAEFPYRRKGELGCRRPAPNASPAAALRLE